MSRLLLVAAALLAACSPTFNWRELSVPPTPLKAMLPCKPDRGERSVPMAGREVSLQVLGCDTGGATFAILTADTGQPARAGEVLDQWKRATLANMRTASGRESPFLPAGAIAIPQSLEVVADGTRADGTPVQSRAAYFARGSRVYQAVVYADRLPAEAAQAFFAGFRFE